MWLKSYLRLDKSRATWALIADVLIAENPLKDYERTPREIRRNVFLQSWKTHSTTDASKTARELLKTAKTFKVRPEGLLY